MSNNCSFHLRFQSCDLEELLAVRDFLQSTPWSWDLSEIELRLPPDEGFRFRGSVQADESSTGNWISGEEGLLADLVSLFSGLRVSGTFRDNHGSGTLDDLEKDYDHPFAPRSEDENGDDALDQEDRDAFEDLVDTAPEGLVIVSSITPLAEDDAEFTDRLNQIAEILRTVGARELGATQVEEETLEWTVSGEVETLSGEQVEFLCRKLRGLRLPLDTRIGGTPSGTVNIWPVKNRPWRSIF